MHKPMRKLTKKEVKLIEEGTSNLSKKIFDRKLVLGDDISKIFAKDVKEFLKVVEEIITRRCMGTSANCYEIKKEIKERAGDELSK